jgi:hypothetical protein
MKRLSYRRIFLVLILLFLTAYLAEAEELTKTVEKTFNLKSDTKISLSNKYGNIIINTWNKNVFDLKVTIEAEGKNESKSQQILDAIEIDISDRISAGNLSISTDIGSIKGNSSFSINYEISMPDKNELELSNSFGNIFMESHDGDADITVKYGQLRAEDLIFADIRVDFSSSRCEIESLKKGSLDLRYSKMSIEELGDVDIESQFSEVEIERGGNLVMNGKYGNIEFESVNSITGDIQFSGVEIEYLGESMDIKAKHGDGIRLENVNVNFTKIFIDTQFSSVEINLEEGSKAQLDFNLQFGNLRARGEGINFNRVIKENNSSEYSGFLASKDASSEVRVTTRYGNIRFEVN